MQRVKSLWLVGFGLVAMAHLAMVAFHVSVADTVTTWILAPLLAAWAWQMDGPKLLVLALALCGVGDALGNPRHSGIGHGGLMLSVAAFAAAHVCFIILFVQRGALAALRVAIGGRQRWRAGLALLYLVVAVAVIWSTRSSFEPAMLTAVLIFALLLVGTATTALALDTRAGIGAALFFASEMLIALAIAGRVDAAATWHRLEVTVLYLVGILLIATGVVNRELSTQRLPRDGVR